MAKKLKRKLLLEIGNAALVVALKIVAYMQKKGEEENGADL